MAAMRGRVSRDGEMASRWEEYHARTAARGPRPLLLRACELLGPGEGRVAVDLGCGSGADVLALAGRGWVVTAVDRDPVALGVLRGQVLGSGLVKIVHTSFAEAVLPQAHLVHAGYSLPFCAPADFPRVWAAVRDALVPGGVFAGQFLGPRDGWAGADGMTFHNAVEVEELLGGLEVCYLREREWEGQSAGGAKRWHAFGVEDRPPKAPRRHLGTLVRGARTAQGVTLAELGRRTGYSAAQVSRYERGLAPLTDITVLRRFAAALGISPQVLGLTSGGLPGRRAPGARNADGDHRPGSAGESVTPYADRGLVTREQWNGIIRSSTGELWLYGMAEYGYATDADVPDILQRATVRGCRVRVLLLNPGSAVSAAIDKDEGHPPGTLAARTSAALARFAAMRRRCGPGMQIRVYDGHPTVSVVRGDDAMLVTPYMRFFIGSNSPTFEFRAREAPKMFTRYTRHFEATWTNAEDWHR